ncbi:hypothetical protein EKM02_08245 [Flavobacterium sp. RSP49]|uniref:hypothetical protein n=1 Tax=Flavobacterium sp. RSP49 TaxID=2497487 RepID=UPI000F84D05D|nr:hypothetical protein [Flavobacterium sp. RSP49]RTZ00424.1 hypothetical protein EKM02_08245 [Flavobacterium sp. RSP49]
MHILKYVINEKKIPVIFSKDIPHCDVMSDVISAGFLIVKFEMNPQKFAVKCFGESSSLNKKKGDEDETLIENYLNNQFCSIVNLKKDSSEVSEEQTRSK